MVRGTDAALRDEFVVVTAHMDHLGVANGRDREGDDSVFNGAVAGSGAIALLEMAKQLSLAPLKRSILFLWTTAHEDGLLGAEYFADTPSVPRDRIAAAVDLDGIAAAPDSMVRRASFSDRLAPLCDASAWHFVRWGIPALRLSANRGEQYRRVTDDVAHVDFGAYASAVNAALERITEIANGPRPARIAPQPNPRTACVTN